jgi:co-chaperonin GroES (HSP10)
VIAPRNDFIFLRQVKETMSPGGIVLVKAERKWAAEGAEHNEGVVVAVGPGKMNKKGARESMWGIAPGDLIAFSPSGNFKQRVEGEELVVIRRDSVIGVMEAEDAGA